MQYLCSDGFKKNEDNLFDPPSTLKNLTEEEEALCAEINFISQSYLCLQTSKATNPQNLPGPRFHIVFVIGLFFHSLFTKEKKTISRSVGR